jgi:hypothetical protein
MKRVQAAPAGFIIHEVQRASRSGCFNFSQVVLRHSMPEVGCATDVKISVRPAFENINVKHLFHGASNVVRQGKSGTSELLRVPVKPALVQVFRHAMEFHSQLAGQVPNLQIFKSPMGPIPILIR